MSIALLHFKCPLTAKENRWVSMGLECTDNPARLLRVEIPAQSTSSRSSLACLSRHLACITVADASKNTSEHAITGTKFA